MKKIDSKILKQLLSEDKSSEVITYLLKLTESKNSRLHNDLVIISSQLRELEGKSRTGVAFIAEAHTQKAKITHSVLSIIDNLTEEDLESNIVWSVETDSTKVIFQSEKSKNKASNKTVEEEKEYKVDNFKTNKWIILSIISCLILGLFSYRILIEKPTKDVEFTVNNSKEQLLANSTQQKDILDEEKRDKEIIKAKINSWNHANEYKNAKILSQLYAEQIEDFYDNKNVTKEYCIADQANYFARNFDTHQSIKSDIDFVKIDDSTYECYFDKEITKNDDIKTFRAILKFQKQAGDFKIIGETTMKDK